MLDDITPVILTLNEAPNIGRTLARLDWAKDVVVVDSLSEDDTVAIARRHASVRLFERKFDSLAGQWNFALESTDITTRWVLALDADYLPSPELIAELARLSPRREVHGYSCRFVYWALGRPLRGSLYPPVTVLFRREGAHYRQDGHAHRVVVRGEVASLRGVVNHDDRKPLRSWVASQNRYMELEAEKLTSVRWSALGWPDRLRRAHLAPLLAPLYALVAKGGLLDGRAGLHYALQRTLAESLLSLHVLESNERRRTGSAP